MSLSEKIIKSDYSLFKGDVFEKSNSSVINYFYND